MSYTASVILRLLSSPLLFSSLLFFSMNTGIPFVHSVSLHCECPLVCLLYRECFAIGIALGNEVESVWGKNGKNVRETARSKLKRKTFEEAAFVVCWKWSRPGARKRGKVNKRTRGSGQGRACCAAFGKRPASFLFVRPILAAVFILFHLSFWECYACTTQRTLTQSNAQGRSS